MLSLCLFLPPGGAPSSFVPKMSAPGQVAALNRILTRKESFFHHNPICSQHVLFTYSCSNPDVRSILIDFLPALSQHTLSQQLLFAKSGCRRLACTDRERHYILVVFVYSSLSSSLAEYSSVRKGSTIGVRNLRKGSECRSGILSRCSIARSISSFQIFRLELPPELPSVFFGVVFILSLPALRDALPFCVFSILSVHNLFLGDLP